ncbi:hypothetical protein A2W54_00625 [Candidatus Giovannonibacteria bacterium RIFCSPHIGHO2_02_43_13]|uniref:Uncharacterized protein n=1 Tax=Candidatus Giovannonibacteria bacterium RIFCSPHIGHO2_02_43_13 TaxID=1798330 RepID=A0A1F5WS65_9BACT|nr:MAG: Protein containing Heat shock protein Hsp20 protein [Parcubacteria group bacterium GW2011_GWA2_44_13]OGF73244.1 MAG: hypothetical protein A3E06_01565 [Candidatus Giovannonibacteria bacterium RIFCSPHIGHO2_12_FULL_44_42]OGF78503.1 MAG: hypothetical protein A2W54_00625 [Candidatus Giovannonibacteria bacterium RIFCSPHIGHO2_02_43_13]OGF89851.1 MAG: hypothetical protein A3I94_02635 [Candidatus Giovannonibacteria bacterium RIFCSPLOWO2_02_FULL_43_54]OGF96693.1 MAG: hypothetical protein A3H08_02
MEKRSFFERLTGSVKLDPTAELAASRTLNIKPMDLGGNRKTAEIQATVAQEEEEATLTADVYQTPDEIVVQTIVAGIKPEDVDVSISQDSITISGKRERAREVTNSDYFYQELYWGSFSRSVLLPQEIDPDEAEATIKNGLLTVRLPKLDRTKIQKLRVKNE